MEELGKVSFKSDTWFSVFFKSSVCTPPLNGNVIICCKPQSGDPGIPYELIAVMVH